MKNQLLLKNFLLRENDTFYMSDDWLLPNSNRSTHTHDFYEFFIVIDGEITQLINEELMELSEKELQILAPDDSHALSATFKKSKICKIHM